MSFYLTTSDIDNTNTAATIKDICMILDEEAHAVNNGLQLVCFFEEFEKPLLLNKRNLQALFRICGTSSPEKMSGHVIQLQTEKTKTAGRTTTYIKVASLDGIIVEQKTGVRTLLN